jgi:poly(hydroxyalkanoate) granule-associated protein
MAVDVRNEVVTQSASVFLMARRALLASLGAVALTLEEGNLFIDRLIERGEVAEADIQKLISDLRSQTHEQEEKAQQARKSMGEKAGAALEESLDVILSRLNVPTKSDIEELSRKIAQLSERIVILKQRNGSNS